MNKLLACVALCIAGTANAQSAEFECLPKELGGGGNALHKIVKDKDVSWSWLCGKPDDTTKLEVVVRLDGYEPFGACKTGIENLYYTFIGVSKAELITIANNIFNICKQAPASGDVDRYKYLVAQHKNHWFPTVEYVVRSNGLSSTRPAYPVINGVRGTAVAGSAKTGEKCDSNVARIGAPPNVYMAFGPAFASNLVTLCSVKPTTP